MVSLVLILRKVIGFFIIFTLTVIFSISVSASESIGTKIQLEKISPNNDTDRSYSIDISAWDESSVNINPCDLVFCLDTSLQMDYLADSPRKGSICFQGSVSREISGIDESTVLYAVDKSEYKPVKYMEDGWYICTSNSSTEKIKRIGTYSDGVDKFSGKVYTKGEAKTRLEYMQGFVWQIIKDLANNSPQNRVSIISFGSEVEVMELNRLNSQNLENIYSFIMSLSDKVTDGRLNVTALENALSIFEENSRDKYLINFSSGICDVLDNPHIDSFDVNKILLVSDSIKNLGVSIYSTGILGYKEDKIQNNSFSNTLSNQKAYSGFVSGSELSTRIGEISRNILSKDEYTIILNVDPRFKISESVEYALSADKLVSIIDNGIDGTSIKIRMNMGNSQDSSWNKYLELVAQKDFFGGNNIELISEGSGIYKEGKLIESIETQMVNVPITLHVNQVIEKAQIGEAVPVYSVSGMAITNKMFDIEQYNWYGKGVTGEFTYTWMDENGKDLGSSDNLSEVLLSNQMYFTLVVAFTPNEAVLTDVGKGVTQVVQKFGTYIVKI